MPISKSKLKFIRSLDTRKGRRKNMAYVVEGVKMVDELLSSEQEILDIFATQEWIDDHPNIENATPVEEQDLKQATFLTIPNQVIAITRVHQEVPPGIKGNILVLDRIQDPGNLGTIIRTAAWFGIPEIWLTKGSVDPYNPKVVQATMGGMFHLTIHFVENKLITERHRLPVYALDMDGENIYATELPEEGLYILGNEGEGVSQDLLGRSVGRLSIPGSGKMESLNVAMSAGILMSEISRRSM